jgi:tRNA 2-selenouridine synthase
MDITPFFENDRQLFDYVRNFDLKSIPKLEDIFRAYKFQFIHINVLAEHIFDKDTLLIDARSEKEYNETSIPGAVNFPLLSTYERHNVGLIYKKYSQTASVKLAIDYAMPKNNQLKRFLLENGAGRKNIFIYCWRGGGRSKYLYKMIKDTGFEAKILTGGIKSYRNIAVKLFDSNDFPGKFLELRGMTGSGKTEILNRLTGNIPLFNLELAARHFSSLFGQIPYKIRDIEPVSSQGSFENNIFKQYLFNNFAFPSSHAYLIESESRKVGDFFIPMNMFSKMETSRFINIYSSLESRIKRIEHDYFSDTERGIAEIMRILALKEKFFRKEMSSRHYESAFNALEKGRTSEFCEIMLTRYYDLKYRVKDKNPLAEICSDNIENAVENVIKEYIGIN